MAFWFLVPLGVCAGIVTTLAGQGGGLFLLLACSALLGPKTALALTAPALLLGNVHRAFVFRRFVDRRVAGLVVLGTIPGAFVGGLFAGVLPPWVLNVMLLGMTALVVFKAIAGRRSSRGATTAQAADPSACVKPRRALGRALVSGGFVVGAATGTAGGAGILFGPMLLAVGLTGPAFVGTTSTVAVAAHVGRVFAYGLAGLFSVALVGPTVALSASITAGNALAERLRRRLSERTTRGLEYAVLLICVGLTVSGLR